MTYAPAAKLPAAQGGQKLLGLGQAALGLGELGALLGEPLRLLLDLLGLLLEVGDVDEGVAVTVAGGTAVTAVVVTVDVEIDVETDVLVVLAGLSTPQATRLSESAELWLPTSAPWCSTIDEPSEPSS